MQTAALGTRKGLEERAAALTAFDAGAAEVSLVVPCGHPVRWMVLRQRERLRADPSQHSHEALNPVEVLQEQAVRIAGVGVVEREGRELPAVHGHLLEHSAVGVRNAGR